jgi:hypothetical protein
MPIEWVKQHYRVEKSPEGIKIFRKSDNKEVSLYDVGEHYEEFQASAYDMDTRDNSGIIKSTMQRQVSQPIKSFDQIVKGLNKESKIKLTKENLNMIQEMVIEAVNAYQATGRTGKTTVITADNKTKTDLTNAGVKLTDF